MRLREGDVGGGTLVAFRRIRRVYRNWFSVLGAYALKRDPKYIELRDGKRIAFGDPPRFDRWLAVQLLPRLLDVGWTIDTLDRTHARLSHAGERLRFTCRFLGKWSDIIPLSEVYVDKVYSGDFRGKTVLDVGMADGDSAVYFARSGASRVIAVEPLPETYALALENLRENGVEQTVVPIQGAVLSEQGPIEIRVPSDAPNQSSAAPDRDQNRVEFDRTISVQTYTLSDLMKAGGVDRLDFVKMDCEGCEYSFLRSLAEEDFARIGRFVLEYHDGPHDLIDILQSHGFRVTSRGNGIGILDARRSSSPIS
ncbi:MAG TPA: FkbM family methyltransferase [Thermoplasmata archaeon]|nr:FkbM family methyltransferase [Thermoplasmata archaeon]